MKEEIYRRKDCRLCGSTKMNEALVLKPSPLCDVYLPEKGRDLPLYPMTLFSCTDCCFVQMSDVVSPELIYKDYIYVTTSSMGLANHFQSSCDNVLEVLDMDKNDLVIDVLRMRF